MTRYLVGFVPCLVIVAFMAAGAQGGIVVYESEEKKVEVGGRMQLQYARIDPDGGSAVDDLFFRRLRIYTAGSVTENWWGKFQVDFGESLDANEVAVKDAFMRYLSDKGNLTLGNSKAPFSRQFLTSSRNLNLISRGFAGDHNFGSPDRALLVKWDGRTASKKVTYAVAGGMTMHDPDTRVMDFDSQVVNQSDWNDGPLFVGRVDVHPLGFVKFNRQDFTGEPSKYNLSAAGYTWNNDGDSNTYTLPGGGSDPAFPDMADLDSARGWELSGGYRGHGVAVDLELQGVSGDTVDPAFTGGIYVNGTTDLDIYSLTASYMIIPSRLEAAAGWDSFDATGYATAWDRTTVGINYYLNRNKLKFQFNYAWGENVFGVAGDDTNTLQIQGQFAF